MTRKIDMEKALSEYKPSEIWGYLTEFHLEWLREKFNCDPNEMLKLAEERDEQRLKFLNFFKQLKASAEKEHSNIAKVTVDLIDDIISQLLPPTAAGRE